MEPTDQLDAASRRDQVRRLGWKHAAWFNISAVEERVPNSLEQRRTWERVTVSGHRLYRHYARDRSFVAIRSIDSTYNRHNLMMFQ